MIIRHHGPCAWWIRSTQRKTSFFTLHSSNRWTVIPIQNFKFTSTFLPRRDLRGRHGAGSFDTISKACLKKRVTHIRGKAETYTNTRHRHRKQSGPYRKAKRKAMSKKSKRPILHGFFVQALAKRTSLVPHFVDAAQNKRTSQNNQNESSSCT